MLRTLLKCAGLAGLVTFLGCRRSREGSTLSTSFDPKHKCLIPKKCSNDGYLRSISEYVGAVYGEDPKVTYDGILTPEEQSYVENTFGKLTGREQVNDFLSSARRQFLQSRRSPVALSTHGAMLQGISYHRLFHHKTFGDALVLLGAHYRAEDFARLYEPFELKIAAEPRNWVFFLEGYGRDDRDETALFLQIAVRLGIPIHSPVLPPWDERVIKEIERRTGLAKIDQAVRILHGQMWGRIEPCRRIPNLPDCHVDVDALAGRKVSTYAEAFNIPRSDLANALLAVR